MSLNAKHTHPVRRMLASVLAGAMLLANLPAAAFAAGTTADSGLPLSAPLPLPQSTLWAKGRPFPAPSS